MGLDGRTVVVGLGGGIACYKACECVRLLVQAGARVRVVMTAAAREFVTPLTLQTLSGHPVGTSTFDLTQESEIGHIQLADAADVVVVAPATANLIARIGAGMADDLLTTVLLATRAPIVVAPAMNVNMWEHPATRENVERLRARGVHVVGPARGMLACGWEGEGRLADPEAIVEAVRGAVAPRDLTGERILVSSGPTREALDPVRYLSNRSSGRMGHALARAAFRRGADVVLVSGPVGIPAPAGVRVVAVVSAREMAAALEEEFVAATVLVMAAAVADYRPKVVHEHKIKKAAHALVVALARNPDIVTGLAGKKGRRLVIGFAAETRDVVAEARRKLREKGLDLVVANDVTAPGAGFDGDTNVVRLVDTTGLDELLPVLRKDEVADRILDWVVARRRLVAARPARRRAAVRPRRS